MEFLILLVLLGIIAVPVFYVLGVFWLIIRAIFAPSNPMVKR